MRNLPPEGEQDMAAGPLNDAVLKDYERDGFVVAKHLFESAEIALRAARQGRSRARPALLRQGRRRGRHGAPLPLEPPRRHHLRHVRALRIDRQLRREASRRRGLSLPFEDDHEGRQGRRRLGMASGLRLLVSERRAVPVCSPALSSPSIRPRAKTAACRSSRARTTSGASITF